MNNTKGSSKVKVAHLT